MSPRIEDLHPDDAATRTALRNQLRLIRQHAGLGQRATAHRYGVRQSGFARIETGDQWLTTTVHRWARTLGHRAVLQPSGFPPVRLPVGVFTAVTPTRPDLVDAWSVSLLQGELAAIRTAVGVTQTRLAAILGTCVAAVSAFEQSTNGTRLVYAQRYTRALARAANRPTAHLHVRLEPLNPPNLEDPGAHPLADQP